MDQQKDNKKYIDNKGQQAASNRFDKAFSPEQRSGYIVRKAEKLTTALYMVSDIIPDKEPVKWKMRETAIELLSDITLSGTASSSDRIAYLRNVTKRAEKLVSFLEIAWATRMLSEMNASILRDEYLVLRGMIEEDIAKLLVGNLGEARVSPRPMISTPRPTPTFSEERSRIPAHTAPSSHVGSRSLHNETRTQPSPRASVSLPEISSGEQASAIADLQVEEKVLRDTQHVAHAPVVSIRPIREERAVVATEKVGKEDRRKIILALLKQRSNLTVRDISKSIPGFSEKTIQRELVAMLEDGQVRKEGEKRWTTYSLA